MGLNPKDIEKAMRRMGIQQQEIDAVEVVIKTADKILTIKKTPGGYPKIYKLPPRNLTNLQRYAKHKSRKGLKNVRNALGIELYNRMF